jgi:flagellar hook protein FlgE
MLQALLAGVASIKAQQTRMNVIGNNLANVNTTAFKGSRVTFQDMLSQTIRGAARPGEDLGGLNPIQFGLGVLVGGTDVNSEQGSLNATNRPTDLAIQGNGFLIVSNGDRIAYTRDGACDLDANGNLVHRATGERIMGYTADSATGQIDTSAPIGPASAIRIPIGARTAVQVTTTTSWAGNLDSREVIASPTPSDLPAVGPPSFASPWRTATVRVYDTTGNQHDLTLGFYRSSTNPSTWHYQVVGDGNGTGVFAATPPTSTNVAEGELLFNSDGQVVDQAGNPAKPKFMVRPATSTGVAQFEVEFDFSSLSQLASESQVQASSQNGFPPGSLQSFSVSTDGIITGLYTNGLTRPLGQLAMAIFPNSGGLERMGSNLWRNTDNSGESVIGAPRTGGRGSLNAGFLEQSNVDIGAEFTDLIITQRGFQANTRVVTTVDEMLQELLNMKR